MIPTELLWRLHAQFRPMAAQKQPPAIFVEAFLSRGFEDGETFGGQGVSTGGVYELFRDPINASRL